MKLSIFRGGVRVTKSSEYIEDWDEFCDLVSRPEIGNKDGDYYVRGPCHERNDNALESIDMLIVDGDSTLNNGSSCIPPDKVHKVLSDLNITHVIYSSYSNDIANGVHKWRLCIPVTLPADVQVLTLYVNDIVSVLHRHDCPVKNVKENLVLSQPWYLPRCPHHTLEDYYYAWHDGNSYSLSGQRIEQTAIVTHSPTCEISESHDSQNFSWEWAYDQLQSGTVHQVAKAMIGWLVRTTDWTDSQIKSFVLSAVTTTCSNGNKVKRVQTTQELDKLITYCREKKGTEKRELASWRDNLYSASELKYTEFPPVKWAIDELIPEGLTILAGDSKIGKSLIAVDITTAIATGTDAFASRKCVEGTCVYYAAEDPPRRVKDRIKKQSDLWSEKFKLVSAGIPQLSDEFYNVLDDMLLTWSDLRCIIIDTLQLIMPKIPQNADAYAYLYKYLDPLKKWALENHVAIICITHTNKTKLAAEDNPFSGIIGNTGYQATSDMMLLLRKNYAKKEGDTNTPDGWLYTRGKEVSTEKYSLEFDSEALRWTLTGKAEEVKINNRLIIYSLLKNEKLKPKDIVDRTGINNATVRTVLKRLLDKNDIARGNDGRYYIEGIEYIIDNGGW